VIGAAVLIGFNDLAARAEFAHRWLSRLVEGNPTVLIEDGRVLTANLAREHLTEDELRASCHRQGITRFQDIERATLETSGAISVILRTPTRDEMMLASISERLERVEALLRERPPAAAQA
jgi:uncharacterized membrane protein YcaP (DUF421 family)